MSAAPVADVQRWGIVDELGQRRSEVEFAADPGKVAVDVWERANHVEVV